MLLVQCDMFFQSLQECLCHPHFFSNYFDVKTTDGRRCKKPTAATDTALKISWTNFLFTTLSLPWAFHDNTYLSFGVLLNARSINVSIAVFLNARSITVSIAILLNARSITVSIAVLLNARSITVSIAVLLNARSITVSIVVPSP